jgi:CIC family chloride channel protein
LPLPNLINQLLGAALTLGTGHPVGREGPGVHLGAAISSLLGERFEVPASQQRLLIGCGSAAAIAALFGLPLAGILFAMEVVLLEYSITGFIAVIVAAVVADQLTETLFTESVHPHLFAETINFSQEIPLLLLLTLAISLCSLFFQELQIRVATRRSPLLGRMMMAGGLVGAVALVLPEILIPVHVSMLGAINESFTLQQILALLACYLVITPIILGLGVPGGVIGPAMAAGGLLGAVIASVSDQMQITTEVSNYALIGMAAMMSAIIHAPLAALVAVFEWSSSSHILTAAMMVIVGSELMMRSVFKRKSIFERMLSLQGMSRNTLAYRRILMSIGVDEVMSRSYSLVGSELSESDQQELLVENHWLIQRVDGKFQLARGMKPLEHEGDAQIEQAEIPLETRTQWRLIANIRDRSNLLQALDLMSENESSALIVIQRGIPVGVLTYAAIQAKFAAHEE